MVTIIGYKESQKDNGESFFKLKIQGGAELVQSKESGKFYLTARTAYISTTFDKATCEKLIGSEMAGSVVKVAVDPYAYTVPDTGEVIMLNHSWEYLPVESENPVKVQTAAPEVPNAEMGW